MRLRGTGARDSVGLRAITIPERKRRGAFRTFLEAGPVAPSRMAVPCASSIPVAAHTSRRLAFHGPCGSAILLRSPAQPHSAHTDAPWVLEMPERRQDGALR